MTMLFCSVMKSSHFIVYTTKAYVPICVHYHVVNNSFPLHLLYTYDDTTSNLNLNGDVKLPIAAIFWL